ncbi:MAG: acyltransferase [Planctomycetota bacterium]|nr:acyltransferase [Planctomycetota bacterium]
MTDSQCRQDAPVPQRFAAIDALRGLGAVGIACYHIHRYGPLPEAADAILPGSIQTLIGHGWMAVQMFFVVAGFVTAYSLRNERLNLSASANFALRRLLRLGIPYWMILLLVLGMSYPAIYGLKDTTLAEPISWHQFLANAFFLHKILGYDSLSAGLWFVCIDLQFGLLMVTLSWLAQRLACGHPRGSTVDVLALTATYVPLALLSLFYFGVGTDDYTWLHTYFYLCFLGVLAWWALERRVPAWFFWTYMVLLVVGLLQRWELESVPTPAEIVAVGEPAESAPLYGVKEVAMAMLTGVGIFLLGRSGHLNTWFKARWLQYLGKISYSLFLIHYPVSWAVTTLGYGLTGERPAAAVCWLGLAVLASVGAADLMYRFVERPSVRWVQRLKLRQSGHADAALSRVPSSRSSVTETV